MDALLVLRGLYPRLAQTFNHSMAQLFHVRVLPHFGRLEDSNDVSWPWKIAGCFIPISLGWAAGDVSFAAYMIPSALAESKCFVRALVPTRTKRV
jgi:hypothetical protein